VLKNEKYCRNNFIFFKKMIQFILRLPEGEYYLFDFHSIDNNFIMGTSGNLLFKININKMNDILFIYSPPSAAVSPLQRPFYDNLEENTIKNDNYRNVRYTDEHIQIVYMSLLPQEEIGMEVHEDTTQFFRIEQGQGKAIISGKEYDLYNGIGITVPQGHYHNIINTSKTEKLKLYTIYSPAHHPPNTLQKFKPRE
jgi:mannose-6-phosphate isomerase-like protein (cupin superfamily)